MVHIATMAVAVSIAVAIITLSVIIGFKSEISAMVSGAMSDVTVVSPYATRQPEENPINDSERLREIILSTDNIAQIERYALCGGVVRGEGGAEGVLLRGVDAEAELSLFEGRLIEGSLPRFEEARRKEVLLSQSIAKRIGAESNSRIELLLLEGDTLRRELFKVCGIYRSALGETGEAIALTDIRNVQKLNGWNSSQITGYACRLHDVTLMTSSSETLNLRLMYEYDGDENLRAVSAEEEYSVIFGWLETHDVNAMVILVIMFIVAVFNMVTVLLIIVLERTRMVGTLKSMGMHNSTIRRIFTYRAIRIIIGGVLIGNLLAITVLLLQKHLHLIRLDETGYFLSAVPVSLGAGWIVAVNILFVAIIVGVTHLATAIIGRIKVADAIKYS